ncbi:MAG: hypothetical protein L3J34_07295 [Flavobacteriaceae bacterium]|nr:hypothetical protein [Flavobacteriaceae bacterium]
MENLNNKTLMLPPEQLEWLLSVKNLFKTSFYNNNIDVQELIIAIKNKAIAKGFIDIGLMTYDNLEKYFKS